METKNIRHEIMPDKKFIIFLTCLGFILFIVALAIGTINGNIVVMFLVGMVLLALFILTGWYREYYHDPISIEVQENGILLTKRYKDAVFIPYEQIVGIGVFPHHGYGGIVPMKGNIYNFPSEIVIEIRNAYIIKMGHQPREWNGKIMAKEYRQSIGIKR